VNQRRAARGGTVHALACARLHIHLHIYIYITMPQRRGRARRRTSEERLKRSLQGAGLEPLIVYRVRAAASCAMKRLQLL
jgi:hypothetical protein